MSNLLKWNTNLIQTGISVPKFTSQTVMYGYSNVPWQQNYIGLDSIHPTSPSSSSQHRSWQQKLNTHVQSVRASLLSSNSSGCNEDSADFSLPVWLSAFLPLSLCKYVNHGRQRHIKLLFERTLPHKEVTDRWNFSCIVFCHFQGEEKPCIVEEFSAQMKGTAVPMQGGGVGGQTVQLNLPFILLIFDDWVDLGTFSALFYLRECACLTHSFTLVNSVNLRSQTFNPLSRITNKVSFIWSVQKMHWKKDLEQIHLYMVSPGLSTQAGNR